MKEFFAWKKRLIKVDLISYLCNIHTLVSFGFFCMIGFFFLRIKKKLKHENLIHVLPLIINNLTYFNEISIFKALHAYIKGVVAELKPYKKLRMMDRGATVYLLRTKRCARF